MDKHIKLLVESLFDDFDDIYNDDTDKEVAKACATIGIDPDYDETEDIVDAIDNDEVYWYKERFGFQIIPVSNVKESDNE